MGEGVDGENIRREEEARWGLWGTRSLGSFLGGGEKERLNMRLFRAGKGFFRERDGRGEN